MLRKSLAEYPFEKPFFLLFGSAITVTGSDFLFLKNIQEFVENVFVLKIGAVKSSLQIRRQILKGGE